MLKKISHELLCVVPLLLGFTLVFIHDWRLALGLFLVLMSERAERAARRAA